MIFIDSNVPMYLIGAPHPNKGIATRLLEKLIIDRRALVTDVEVFQEILHRYVAIRRPDAIQPAFDVLQGLVDNISSITPQDVEMAKDIILGETERVSARDAIHVAVMRRLNIDSIMSFDRDFDAFESLTRLSEC